MIYHKRKFISYVYIVEGTDAAFKAIFTWRVMYFVGAINIFDDYKTFMRYYL